MYINRKDGTLVEAEIRTDNYGGNPYWCITHNGKFVGFYTTADFEAQYGEAMICSNKECKARTECGDSKPHIKNSDCGAFCIPYIPEEQKEYDVDNEPVFPVCGTCNARKEIDTWHEKEVICPWCGHKHIDSWEMGTGEYVCSKCEKPFYVEKEIEVYYTTTKVEVKSDGK